MTTATRECGDNPIQLKTGLLWALSDELFNVVKKNGKETRERKVSFNYFSADKTSLVVKEKLTDM